MTKKFQFVVNERLSDTLETLKTKTGRDTYAEVLRDALRTYLWVVQEYEKGNEIIAKNRDPQTFNPFAANVAVPIRTPAVTTRS